MDNLNDLKKIWHTADTTGLPNSKEIMEMGKKFRDQKFRKKLFLIITTIISTGLMIAAMFFYKSQLVITRIGEICIVISGAMLIYTNTNSIGRFYRYKDYSNKEFIAFLEQTRLNQIYFYKKTQFISMLFYTVGLLFYLFELVRGNTVLLIIFYTLSITGLLILWLYQRPRSFKKQTAKLNETIQRLKALSDQL